MVSSRYVAYRAYMGGRAGALSLEGWFRFYRLEKESEAPDQTGGVVSGCSATGEAVAQNALAHPAFLQILRLRLEGPQPEAAGNQPDTRRAESL